MHKRRLFRFAYQMPCRSGRQAHPFQMRDGEAATYLSHAIAEHGYGFGKTIFNYPLPGPENVPLKEIQDETYFRETDIIVLSTRPPMDDSDLGERRHIDRSFTWLEEKLFQQPLKHWIKYCTRPEVVLTNEAARVSPAIAARQSMMFYQHNGPWYRTVGSPITRDWQDFKATPVTAAFLVYAEHAWPGGPAFLAAFSMGGTETLVWCYLLNTKFSHLLCSTPFVMAEMRARVLPDRPETMSFADSYEVTILGKAPMSSDGCAA